MFKISKCLSYCKKDADLILTLFIERIVDTVSEGEKVTLVGLGSCKKRHRKARDGHNPRTGEMLTILARDVPTFRAEKFLLRALHPNSINS